MGLTDFIVTRKCKSGQYLRLNSRFFCAVSALPQRLAKNSVAARARWGGWKGAVGKEELMEEYLWVLEEEEVSGRSREMFVYSILAVTAVLLRDSVCVYEYACK